jgi:hypothetical protein
MDGRSAPKEGVGKAPELPFTGSLPYYSWTSDGHRFDPRWPGQPRRCDFPGEVQGTWEWTKGFFVKCFVQAQSGG